MSCATNCASEQVSQDEVSPGPVGDLEYVCRAAYGKKMHYNASGRLRPSFVKNNDLLSGSLSVWRRHSGSEEELTTIRGIVSGYAPAESSLYDMFGALAKDIRAVRSAQKPDTQALHVYDDCRTDNNGGKHPNHAVIAICSDCDPSALSSESLLYIEIRDELVKLLKQTVVWSLPAEQRI